jgi:hypothetical protein
VWRGTGRDGSGGLSTDSGVLAETPYSFKTRVDSEKGTNPEELIASPFVSPMNGMTPMAGGSAAMATKIGNLPRMA